MTVIKKNTTLLFVLFSTIFTSAQNLTDGSILFTSVQSDGDDRFSFVAMQDVPAYEVIYFTDDALDSLENRRGSEGVITWTASEQGVVKGVAVEIYDTIDGYKATNGTAERSGSFTLSTSGDQIFAYQSGANDTVYLAAINLGTSNSWITTGEADANKSYLPEGLTSVVSFPSHKDNGSFNCPQNVQTTEQLRFSVLDIQNWTVSDEVIGVYCQSFMLDDVVGLEEKLTFDEIQIYPNPVTNGTLFFEEELSGIQIFDVSGQLMIEKEKATEIVIENLPSGMYFLNSNQGNKRFIVK